MLNDVERVMFVLLVLVSVGAAVGTFGEMFAVINRGQGRIPLDELPRRLVKGVIALFSQGDIIKRRPITSLFHYALAWSFLFYFLVNAVDIAEGFIPGFRLLEDNVVGNLFRLGADIMTIAGLVGVSYLLLRRFVGQPRSLTFRDNVLLHDKVRAGIPNDSALVGLFILAHLSGRYLSVSFLLAREGADSWQPFGTLASNLLLGLPETALVSGWHIGWWVALSTILLFLPYFPYTKHAHLFMGPLNIMTRKERPAMGALEPIDFEDESIEQFGVNKLLDLSKSQVMDAFACIMCNRCQDACPAYATGKELSPAALEVNKRYYIKEQMAALAEGRDERPLIDYAISYSAVWACTTCGACVEACPVGNEPMIDILDMRRDLVLMESNFPDDLKSAFVGMERLSNPWGMTENRMAWARPLDFPVPTVAENPDYEYLFWVGCAGAFDPGAQEVARAVATILQAAGVSFAVLGEQESCTGDSARRAGNEYLFTEMAQANIALLDSVNAHERRIVTSCPHCFTTIGKEYAALGGEYTVFHHTQLIGDLVGKGRLRLNGQTLEQTTFHDPCYLGRHNDIYEAPREALAKAGATLLEMDRSKEKSFCCGAGGAQMWKEEEHGEQPVNGNRFAEANRTGAKTLAVGCPFCAIMLRDANQQQGAPMAVKDVAQVVVEALG